VTQTVSDTDTLVTQMVIETKMSMMQMVSDTKHVSDINGLFLRRTAYYERNGSYIRIV